MELDAAVEAMRSELTQAKLAAAALEGRQRTAADEVARLRTQDASSVKTISQLRDSLHQESCKAARSETFSKVSD